MFSHGDTVIVHECVLDNRCKSGLRLKPVTEGTLWRTEFFENGGLSYHGVMTEESNYVISIPTCLLKGK